MRALRLWTVAVAAAAEFSGANCAPVLEELRSESDCAADEARATFARLMHVIVTNPRSRVAALERDFKTYQAAEEERKRKPEEPEAAMTEPFDKWSLVIYISQHMRMLEQWLGQELLEKIVTPKDESLDGRLAKYWEAVATAEERQRSVDADPPEEIVPPTLRRCYAIHDAMETKVQLLAKNSKELAPYFEKWNSNRESATRDTLHLSELSERAANPKQWTPYMDSEAFSKLGDRDNLDNRQATAFQIAQLVLGGKSRTESGATVFDQTPNYDCSDNVLSSNVGDSKVNLMKKSGGSKKARSGKPRRRRAVTRRRGGRRERYGKRGGGQRNKRRAAVAAKIAPAA